MCIFGENLAEISEFSSPTQKPRIPRKPPSSSGWGGGGIFPPLYIYVLGVSEGICEGMEEIG